jgi:hypothetical protein
MAAAACTQTSPSGVASGATPNASSTPGKGMEPGAALPEVLEFEAPLLGGATLAGSELAGKDVAFWFWAPW